MRKRLILVTLSTIPAALLAGQSQQPAGLDPAAIRRPLSDSWPVYSGDYTGRRYSALQQINATTVKSLTLAWVMRLNAGSADSGESRRGGGRGGGGGAPTIVGGEGTGEFGGGGAPTVKGAILMVGNVLYVTAPDNVWALDAHD